MQKYLMLKATNWVNVYCTKCTILKVSIAQNAKVQNAQMHRLSECILYRMHHAKSVYCTKCISIHPMLKNTDLVWKQNAKCANALAEWLSMKQNAHDHDLNLDVYICKNRIQVSFMTFTIRGKVKKNVCFFILRIFPRYGEGGSVFLNFMWNFGGHYFWPSNTHSYP